MANGQDTRQVTLGTGVLKLNSTAVGFLKGDVSLSIAREQRTFESGVPLTPRKRVIIRETASLKATMAQLYTDKLQYVLGTGVISTPQAGQSKFSFGGDADIDEFSLEFVHAVPNTSATITVVLYKVNPMSTLEVPFKEEDFLLYNMEWAAKNDDEKSAGEQLGYVLFDGFDAS